MDICRNCGSESFEEIDALYYCSICSTQLVGRTVEISHHADHYAGPLREIREASRRKRQGDDTGVPWTTNEAFNIILVHQCSQLENQLHLKDSTFKETLLALWAAYLQKCEVAFCGPDHEKPKIHLTSHSRDIQLICEGKNKVSKTVNKVHRPKAEIKVGNTRIKRHVYFASNINNQDEIQIEKIPEMGDYSSSQDEDDDDLSRNAPPTNFSQDSGVPMDQSGDLVMPSSALNDTTVIQSNNQEVNNPDYLTENVHEASNNADLNDANLSPNETVNTERQCEVVSLPQEDDHESIASHDTGLTKTSGFSVGLKLAQPTKRKATNAAIRKRLRQALDKLDQGCNIDDLLDEFGVNENKIVPQTNGEPCDAEVEQDEDENDETFHLASLSTRSRLIKQILQNVPGKDAILRNSDDLTIERMTIHRTLCFILLAFRVANINVHANDIIHWIRMGYLTFYDAHKILPEEWMLLPGSDTNVIHPSKDIAIETVERGSAILLNFLSIPSLPFPDFAEMVRRHVTELNLPAQLASIVLKKVNFKADRLFGRAFKKKRKITTIPCYEVNSFCAIIVILKKLFGLNGFSEFAMSEQVRKDFPDSFIWEDWYKHTKTFWKFFGQHYIPLTESFESDIIDGEVIRFHHKNVSHSWIGGQSTVVSEQRTFLSVDFHEEMSELLETTLKIDQSNIEPPPFSVYHFHEAKKFIAQRLNSFNRLPEICDLDFTQKSMAYLTDPQYSTVIPYLLSQKKAEKSWTEVLTTWPESLKLLIEVGCFITNRPPERLARVIYKMDTYL